ncbi:MAG: hypothetical protein ACLVKA_04290 [Collinsella aerofaciens]
MTKDLVACEKEPGASGTVSLTVKVTNDAVTTVENQATITIGNNPDH